MIPYRDQSARELRLQLWGGAIDLDALTVLESGGLEGPGFSLRAGILGASHHVSLIGPGGAALHEVLACEEAAPRDAAGAGARRLYAARVDELPDPFEYSPGEGFVYRFERRVEWGDACAAALVGLADRVGDPGPNGLGLRHDFPRTGPGPAGCTLLWASLGAGRLVAETAHSYPNEGRVLLSYSRIAFGAVA